MTPRTDFNKPLDYTVVKGRTALVQDGASGLGYGIAEALAENGAKVAICDENVENGDKVVADLTSKGYRVSFFKTDATNWDSVLASFKAALEWSGDQLDIVVTSPGIVTNNLMMSILPKHTSPDGDPPKPPTKVFEVDLIGVYYTASLALFYFNQIAARRKRDSGTATPSEDEKARAFRPQLLYICSMAGVRIDSSMLLRGFYMLICS